MMIINNWPSEAPGADWEWRSVAEFNADCAPRLHVLHRAAHILDHILQSATRHHRLQLTFSITLCNVRLTLYNSAPWSVPWACSMGRGASHPLFSFAPLKFVQTTYRLRMCPGSERFCCFISKLYELAFNHKFKQKASLCFCQLYL